MGTSSPHTVFLRYSTAPATSASIRNGPLRMSACCSPISLPRRGPWHSHAPNFAASDERDEKGDGDSDARWRLANPCLVGSRRRTCRGGGHCLRLVVEL